MAEQNAKEKKGSPKYAVLFGAICITAGVLAFIFFENMMKHPPRRYKAMLEFLEDNLGKYGFSGILVGGGLIVVLLGLRSYLKEKKTANGA